MKKPDTIQYIVYFQFYKIVEKYKLFYSDRRPVIAWGQRVEEEWGGGE